MNNKFKNSIFRINKFLPILNQWLVRRVNGVYSRVNLVLKG